MVYWWFALAHDDGWNLIAKFLCSQPVPNGFLMMFLKFPMSSSPKGVVRMALKKFLCSQPVPNGFLMMFLKSPMSSSPKGVVRMAFKKFSTCSQPVPICSQWVPSVLHNLRPPPIPTFENNITPSSSCNLHCSHA